MESTVDLNFWQNKSFNLMNIVPYMELFNTSEVSMITQSVDEKVSDEYVAARKVYSIAKAFYETYEVDSDENIDQFDHKIFFQNSFLTLLIYPLDGYRSSKKVYFPASRGPKWCWPAFIIPELWFIWHEIWGVSLLVIFIEHVTVFKLFQYGVDTINIMVVGFLLFIYHFLLGLLGNKLFYLRYAKWPKKKQFKNSSDEVGHLKKKDL